MIEPLKDRVILESFPDDLRGDAVRTKALIIIPEMYTETSRLAKVIALSGPARELLPEVEVGDTVMCNRYPPSAQPFKDGDRELVSVKAEDVLLRLEVM